MNTLPLELLHKDLLTCWNNQDAAGMAALFTNEANVVGFDGSQYNSKAEIETEMEKIFSNHHTAHYIWKIREIRQLAPGVAIVRAVAGMVPPGKTDIKQEVNAIQSVIAVEQGGEWKISLFQNTPARFDGRPLLVEAMTNELRECITDLISSNDDQ
jgi:uncharacterized protein (TIGR02246 family)